jgi:hypothetical protein
MANQNLLAAFFTDLLLASASSECAELVSDNARSHEQPQPLKAEKKLQDHRWHSSSSSSLWYIDSDEEEESVEEELQIPQKPSRISRRSRFQKKKNLPIVSSPPQAAPKQPQRQLTPEMSEGIIQKALTLRQPQRQRTREEVMPLTAQKRHFTLRKPVRTTTPPTTKDGPRCGEGRSSPPVAMVPDKNQYVRQGSLD